MMRTTLNQITLIDASKRLGITKEALQRGLIEKVFPFGVAITNFENKHRRYSFYIFEELLQMFIEGELSCMCSKCMQAVLEINEFYD